VARKFDAVNEQVVLVSMLQDPGLLGVGLGTLSPEDFVGERHKVVFAGIRGSVERGFDVSPKNVALFCGSSEFGGLEYLEGLWNLGGAAANPKEFAFHMDALRKDAVRFKMARQVREFSEMMMDKTRSFEECERAMVQASSEMTVAGASSSAPGRSELMEEWLREFEALRSGERSVFRSTGIEALDSVSTEGFAAGSFTVLAGRPRMGKSVLMTDLVRRALIPADRQRVLVIPFEKGKKYFVNMLVASLSKVDLDVIIKYPDEMTEQEDAAVRKAAEWVKRRMEEGDLSILDSPVIKMLQDEKWNNRKAMDEIERIVASGKYGLVFFDLFERVLASNLDAQQIALALIRAQMMCPKYGLHLVITQQLRRSAEDLKRPGKRRPTLLDLKNSGGYEEIPDQILLIHREKVFKPLLAKDEVELRLAKQKLGEDGMTIVGEFRPAICRITNDRVMRPGDAVGKGLFTEKEGEGDDS
jgi:replicative DNA helicase